MNSTLTSLTAPPITNPLACTALAWASIAFAIASCLIVGRKAVLDFTLLRGACLVMGLMNVGLGIGNMLLISQDIDTLAFMVLNTLEMIFTLDLLVAVTLNLGSSFYIDHPRINMLYWTVIVTTVAANILEIPGLVLMISLSTYNLGRELHISALVLGLAGFFLSFCYVFRPVVTSRTGMRGVPSTVAAVGIWYLSGIAIIVIVSIVPLGLTMANSDPRYNDIHINLDSIGVFIRMILYDFYSLPPSKYILDQLRQRFFPSILVKASIATTSHPTPGTQVTDGDDSTWVASKSAGERV